MNIINNLVVKLHTVVKGGLWTLYKLQTLLCCSLTHNALRWKTNFTLENEDEHCNCFKGMTLGIFLRWGGAHMGYSQRIDTIWN